LEKIFKQNKLNLIETKYIECEFEKTSGLAIIAAIYSIVSLLVEKEVFYLWLSAIYVKVSLLFFFLGFEVSCAFALVAAGYSLIYFIHQNALTWQNTELASWFASPNAFSVWISIFYLLAALICIAIGFKRREFALKFVGLYLILMALWKLFFL